MGTWAVGGPWADVIEEYGFGVTVTPESPEAIADAIPQFEDRDRWEACSRAGVEYIREKASWEKVLGGSTNRCESRGHGAAAALRCPMRSGGAAMSERLHIIHVMWTLPSLGGAEQVMLDLALASVRCGGAVTVVVRREFGPGNPYACSARRAGIAVAAPNFGVLTGLRLLATTASLSAATLLAAPYAMQRHMKATEAWSHVRADVAWEVHRRLIEPTYDFWLRCNLERALASSPDTPLLHVHDTYQAAAVATKWAIARRVPVVCHHHHYMTNEAARQRRNRLSPEDLCLVATYPIHVVQSSRMVEAVRALFGRDARVAVIPNWALARAAASGTRRRTVVGSVGRLIDVKGFDVLIRAVGLLLEKGLDLECRIAGVGPELSALQSLAVETHCAEAVRFCGRVARDDLSSFLGDLDVFVAASRMEAMPLAVLEAMAHGLPVVATAVGGVPEVVVHEETGLLVEPGDVEGLAAAIERVARRRDWARHLGERGEHRWRAHFSEEAVWPQWERLYASLVAGTPLPDRLQAGHG